MATDNNRNLKCNDCGQTFTRGSALATHIKFKHQNYKFKETECKWNCGTSTHSSHTLKRHEEICWLNPVNTAHCKSCGVLIERVVRRDSTKDKREYCGNSCAAKVSNSNRKVTWAEKTRKSVNEFYDKDPRYRNYEEQKLYKPWRKKAHRYSIQQLKDLRKDLYEYWQSNPYTGKGDTSRLSLEHKKPLIECFREGIPIEEAGHINNLEIISYRENNLRYKKLKKA
jgi:hypothetical protein